MHEHDTRFFTSADHGGQTTLRPVQRPGQKLRAPRQALRQGAAMHYGLSVVADTLPFLHQGRCKLG